MPLFFRRRSAIVPVFTVLAALALLASTTPALATCGPVTGLSASAGNPASAHVSWNPTPQATSYEYVYCQGGYVNVMVNSDTTGTSITVYALQGASVSVRARCGSEVGLWSVVNIPNPGLEVD